VIDPADTAIRRHQASRIATGQQLSCGLPAEDRADRHDHRRHPDDCGGRDVFGPPAARLDEEFTLSVREREVVAAVVSA
jgi:hypothetical protein